MKFLKNFEKTPSINNIVENDQPIRSLVVDAKKLKQEMYKSANADANTKEKGNKREKKKHYKKAKGEAYIGKEWDSDCSSSESDNEGLAATAFNKSSLFPNKHHTCLMAKEKKVCTRNTTYASSSGSYSP